MRTVQLSNCYWHLGLILRRVTKTAGNREIRKVKWQTERTPASGDYDRKMIWLPEVSILTALSWCCWLDCGWENWVHCTCHALRITFATRFIEQRPQDYKILSDIMGHKDISITLKLYTRVMKENKIAAMNGVNIKMSEGWKIVFRGVWFSVPGNCLTKALYLLKCS